MSFLWLFQACHTWWQGMCSQNMLGGTIHTPNYFSPMTQGAVTQDIKSLQQRQMRGSTAATGRLWDPAPPRPSPLPLTSSSWLCRALGNTWSSHPATEGLEATWWRRKRRGNHHGCPTFQHCLQEKIQLCNSLTEGKFCPKASCNWWALILMSCFIYCGSLCN